MYDKALPTGELQGHGASKFPMARHSEIADAIYTLLLFLMFVELGGLMLRRVTFWPRTLGVREKKAHKAYIFVGKKIFWISLLENQIKNLQDKGVVRLVFILVHTARQAQKQVEDLVFFEFKKELLVHIRARKLVGR